MKKVEALEISFHLHPGSRVPPTGAEARSTERPGRLPRVTQVLALAIHFENMIAQCEAKDYSDLARLGGLSRERVSQIMRLNYLAPEIQVELLYLPPTLTGRFPISEVSIRKIASILSWPEQRCEWARTKALHHLV